MAYLLDKDSFNGEGGKICRTDNLQVELSEREELKLFADKLGAELKITIAPKTKA